MIIKYLTQLYIRISFKYLRFLIKLYKKIKLKTLKRHIETHSIKIFKLCRETSIISLEEEKFSNQCIKDL